MKRLLLLLALLPSLCWAKPSFVPGQKYRFMCSYWKQGSVVDGKFLGFSYPLYYNVYDQGNSPAAFWYVDEVEEGKYTIRNAASQYYLTYDGVKSDVKRYLDLTYLSQGDASLWTFEEKDGYYVIRNVKENIQVWDARTDSYILGSFAPGNAYHHNNFFAVLDEKGNFVTEQNGETQSGITQLVDSITINGKNAVYDLNSNCYFQTIPQQFMSNTDLEVACKAFVKDSTKVAVRINDQAQTGVAQFENFKYGTKYPITVVDRTTDELLAKAEITFTFLPIVEFTGDKINFNTYMPGTIRVTDPESTGYTTTYRSKIRYRGATASGMQKKAYAVKLVDSIGASLNASFMGMRSDNNWILDAMAVDPARMRNRVSTDLWNDFSITPYHFIREPKAHNGTRGRFVEAFYNGRYHGLYCMTEKIDRKQLKLKKIRMAMQVGDNDTIHGALYKSNQWSYSVFMGHNPDVKYYPMTVVSAYKNTSENWDRWEMQYPKLGDGESIDWGPLTKAINVVASYDKQNFMTHVGEQFDLPVFLDYYLFIELIMATDNHGKNIFLHHYDTKTSKMVSMTPWDLDGTWGRRWDGSPYTRKYAATDFRTYLWNHEHGEHTLYKRLMEYNFENWNEQLAGRYASLRTTHFSEENLYKRFEQYARLFQASGADVREKQMWSSKDPNFMDLDSELDFLKDWIHKRLAYLDRCYHYQPSTTGMHSVESNLLTVCGDKGCILVRSNAAQQVQIYNLSGALIRQQIVPAGVSRIAISQPGVYLIRGEKAVVR